MQLSGNESELVADAARQCEALGADIIDINCGCPSPKVTGGGHGSALLRDLPKMGRLLEAVRAAVNIPVTLKFRAGWDDESLNYLDTARLAESCGVSALALHPRTKSQGYSGSADWSRIAEVKQAVKIPVLGSGDVKSAVDALDRLAETGTDGVMIGRGAMANPWIFLQVEQLRSGAPVFQPGPADKRAFLLRYMDMLLETMLEHQATGKIKQLIGQFSVGMHGSNQLRRDVQHARTLAEQRDIIERYFEPFILGGVTPSGTEDVPEVMEDALVES
jgi:nifR3 family TIM-barrel protein